MPELTIAVAKGRMQDEALALLERAGVRICAEARNSRRLSVADESGSYRFIFVKPSDVPVYVEHGTADCGIVGRDVLLESNADVLQPLDLRISPCRIAVAACAGAIKSELGALRVATKYPRVASAHFGARGIPVCHCPRDGARGHPWAARRGCPSGGWRRIPRRPGSRGR